MKLGKYLHYKGTYINVTGIAKHSETLENMVIYEHSDSIKGFEGITLRVRPQSMFEENIIIDGKEVPRFQYIG